MLLNLWVKGLFIMKFVNQKMLLDETVVFYTVTFMPYVLR